MKCRYDTLNGAAEITNKQVLTGLGKVVTGAVIATASVVGGPVYVGLLAGICTGVVANKLMNKVDGAAIRDFVTEYLNSVMEESPDFFPRPIK